MDRIQNLEKGDMSLLYETTKVTLISYFKEACLEQPSGL